MEYVACRDCKNFVKQTESWDMPHIFWYECAAEVQMSNLRSFPFKRVRCKSFSPRAAAKQKEDILG